METCLRKGSGRACDACCVPSPTRALIPQVGARRRKVDGDGWPRSCRRRMLGATAMVLPPSFSNERRASSGVRRQRTTERQLSPTDCLRSADWRRSRVARPSPPSVMTASAASATWWRLPFTGLEDASPCAPAFVITHINRAMDPACACKTHASSRCATHDTRQRRLALHAHHDSESTVSCHHHGGLASGVVSRVLGDISESSPSAHYWRRDTGSLRLLPEYEPQYPVPKIQPEPSQQGPSTKCDPAQ